MSNSFSLCAEMPSSKLMCPEDDEQLRAFRACPVLQADAFQAWLPDVMWAAQALADTLAVCWEWGLLALLTVCSGLIPEDRFEPAPSISIPSSLWVVLLHPGATNSSGVVKTVANAVATMFDRLHIQENLGRPAEDAERSSSPSTPGWGRILGRHWLANESPAKSRRSSLCGT